MGTGYTLGCKKCGYKISGNLGVGFFFPKAYQETMRAAREGKLGKRIQRFLEEHPDGALKAETVFLQCEECGKLTCGMDLSMYIRNPEMPRKEHGRWSVAMPFEEEDYVSPMELEDEGTYQFYDYGNLCEKCGKPMKPITDNELMDNNARDENDGSTVVTCPRCKERLWIEDIIMWD
ncbi:hypothetical protein JRC49_10965 [Clostridiales bacterium FE2011]|nr:hypothetical protein JRC49_10965 [Clostridiales bacterium FE2011]